LLVVLNFWNFRRNWDPCYARRWHCNILLNVATTLRRSRKTLLLNIYLAKSKWKFKKFSTLAGSALFHWYLVRKQSYTWRTRNLLTLGKLFSINKLMFWNEV